MKTINIKGIVIAVLLIGVLVVFAITHKSNTTPTTVATSTPATSTPSTPVDTTPVATTTASTTPITPHDLRLDSASPSSGAVGTSVTLKGSGFSTTSTVLFNSNVAARDIHLTFEAGQMQAITFTVPSSLTADCKANEACPMYAILVTPGTYVVSVENENGKSNTIQFSVTK